MSDINGFEKDLTQIINKHSMESMVNLPDWILARLITMNLIAMSYAIEENKARFE